MSDHEDWSVGCSDDEMYSGWQSIKETNGRVLVVPPDSKLAQLYLSVESGQIEDKLKWKRRVVQIEADSIYQEGLYPEDLSEMPQQGDTVPDVQTKSDSLVNANDDFGFQDDLSETGIEMYHRRSRAKRERAPVSKKASFDRILRNMKSKK